MPKQITTLAELENLLPSFYPQILNQARKGDPDWLSDIIQELDTITYSSPFYLPQFHGVLQPLGYTSAHFNTQALLTELTA